MAELDEYPRIYVSGPLSMGDTQANIKIAIDVASTLLRMGSTPILPHLTHYWDLVRPENYETWIQYDMRLVRCCHALYRIPGESPGADREVGLAKRLRLPVLGDSVQAREFIADYRRLMYHANAMGGAPCGD